MALPETMRKVFTLIRLLNTPPAKDVKQLERQSGISRSRLYEYLKLLEEIGYVIHTDENNRKSFEFTVPKDGIGVLGADELGYLQELLQNFSSDHFLSKNILHKFKLGLSLIPVADALPQLHKGRILQLIRAGIDSGYCIQLCKYRSLTSNSVEDRLVEPMQITDDYRYLIAWDLGKNDQRQFKLDRIEDVDLTDQRVQQGRTPSPMDLFGLTGDSWIPVKMTLSSTAHHLLLEEFPLSQRFIRKVNDHIVFDGLVRNWKGIGRFILGLPGEIKIVEPQELKEYIQQKIQEF